MLDAYPYATTSPIYVTIAGSSPKASEDAAYFVAWIDRMIQDANSNRDWNTEAEKTSVLDLLNHARRSLRWFGKMIVPGQLVRCRRR